jgi:hypothetical protein
VAKLKLRSIPDDKPVKRSVELSAAVHRSLVVYAEILATETGQIAPMLARFVATEGKFAKLRHATQARSTSSG